MLLDSINPTTHKHAHAHAYGAVCAHYTRTRLRVYRITSLKMRSRRVDERTQTREIRQIGVLALKCIKELNKCDLSQIQLSDEEEKLKLINKIKSKYIIILS